MNADRSSPWVRDAFRRVTAAFGLGEDEILNDRGLYARAARAAICTLMSRDGRSTGEIGAALARDPSTVNSILRRSLQYGCHASLSVRIPYVKATEAP